MNKTPRLSRSGIEYLTHTWGFYSGCENSERGICPLGKDCWARKITKRFEHHYPNGFEPTFYPEAFLSPLHLKKPSIIGVAFMGDLFGDWVDPKSGVWVDLPYNKLEMSLRGAIFATIVACPQHTFLFLTKCPWNLLKWSPFPDNCWIGVTATDLDSMVKACAYLLYIGAKVKFISYEPLLGDIDGALWPEPSKATKNTFTPNWVIIGAQTNPYKPPKIEWVEEIVRACDKAGIPVFLKDNLWNLIKPLKCDDARNLIDFKSMELRQEIP